MNKYEQLFELDKDNFFTCLFFAELVQFGVFANVFMSQVGVL